MIGRFLPQATFFRKFKQKKPTAFAVGQIAFLADEITEYRNEQIKQDHKQRNKAHADISDLFHRACKRLTFALVVEGVSLSAQCADAVTVARLNKYRNDSHYRAQKRADNANKKYCIVKFK